jgi:hypothetical protein
MTNKSHWYYDLKKKQMTLYVGEGHAYGTFRIFDPTLGLGQDLKNPEGPIHRPFSYTIGCSWSPKFSRILKFSSLSYLKVAKFG